MNFLGSRCGSFSLCAFAAVPGQERMRCIW
jgi:hypothetical protein